MIQSFQLFVFALCQIIGASNKPVNLGIDWTWTVKHISGEPLSVSSD